MTTAAVAEVLPEWEPFAYAARQLGPQVGTWCEAWTVRDIVAHQAGTAARPRRGRVELGRWGRIEGRLRTPATDDVVVVASPDGNSIWRAAPEGAATLECDSAARVLFLWGRRPTEADRWRSDAGPDMLRAVRTLLSGY